MTDMMKTRLLILVAGTLACGILTNVSAQPALKEVFTNDFLIGAALNPRHFSGDTNDEVLIIQKHFNTITAENAMKWMHLQPRRGEFTFSQADRFVEFGQKHGMTIIGHTLVWHSQTPRWVLQDSDGEPLTREALLERMREHIHTVVGRYKGRIRG